MYSGDSVFLTRFFFRFCGFLLHLHRVRFEYVTNVTKDVSKT